MKKQNTKNNKGITLIALVITIIVLLILAMVSIRLVLNGGIIAHAENATSSYKIAEEKEKIALGYSEYQMEKYTNPNATLAVEGATVTADSNGWKVEFESGKSYNISPDGEISTVAPYVPVVNPNPTEWTIAYAYDGNNWTKYTESDQTEGGRAEGGVLQGQLVAKFIKKNTPVEASSFNLGTGDISVPAKNESYELYIEGTEMPSMADFTTATGYGYQETLTDAVTTFNAQNSLISYVTNVVICEGVQNIGAGAFAGGINIKSIKIPKTVNTIGELAFIGSGIENFVVLEGVTTIGENAFEGCNSLTSITLHEKITSIGDNAFRNTGLTNITIPASVNKIGSAAFQDCANLKEVIINSEECDINIYAFQNIGSNVEGGSIIWVENENIKNKLIVISGYTVKLKSEK